MDVSRVWCSPTRSNHGEEEEGNKDEGDQGERRDERDGSNVARTDGDRGDGGGSGRGEGNEARKAKASKAKVKATKVTKRGGRKPGTWTLVTSGAIKDFRKSARLSRAQLASELGVSATTIQNWETERAVPMRTWQERLAALIGSGTPVGGENASTRKGAASVKRVASRSSRETGTDGVDGAVSVARLKATGEILKGFLASSAGQRLKPDDLVALTASLQGALV